VACLTRRPAVRIVALAAMLIVLVAPTHGASASPAAGTHACSLANQRYLRQQMNASLSPTVPGEIYGSWGTGIYCAVTYGAGMADVAAKRPASVQDAVRIGGITQTFVGTLVLQLVDQHVLSLDTPVGRWLPSAPEANRVTIRELLSHTSGLYNYTEDPDLWRQTLALCGQGQRQVVCGRHWQPQELLAIAAKHVPYFAPGTDFYLSNTDFIILGLLLEQVTGQPLASLLQTMICQPLHLTHTFLPAGAELPPDALHGYMQLPGSTRLVDVTRVDTSVLWAAGGMVSTLDDLRVWAQALATGTLLSPKLQEQRLQWTAQSQLYRYPYGLAVQQNLDVIGDGGTFPGYAVEMWYSPDLRGGWVMIANSYTYLSGVDPAIELAPAP